MRYGKVLLVACACLLVSALVFIGRSRAAARLDCAQGSGRFILVDTSAHQLALCDARRPVEMFAIRIGSKGVGKRAEGDSKTPLGTYPLGAPRPSSKYGMFIPIAYPTASQRREGYTGGAVGVHGPDRRVRWLGRWVNTLDTTDGCVGIASDDEMNRIAAWVRLERVQEIVIR